MRSLAAMLQMRTDFEANDDVDDVETAEAELREKAAVDEVSLAPDDEHADERFSTSATDGSGIELASRLMLLLPLPLLAMLPTLLPPLS